MLLSAVIRRNSWEVHWLFSNHSELLLCNHKIPHSREETTNYNNKKPTLSDQNIILLQAEVDKDI